MTFRMRGGDNSPGPLPDPYLLRDLRALTRVPHPSGRPWTLKELQRRVYKLVSLSTIRRYLIEFNLPRHAGRGGRRVKP